MTSGCAPTPACTGNGVIAPLRDGRGAEPGVKDTRRPPFWTAGKVDWRVSVDTRRRARPHPTRAGARGDGVERVEGEPDDHALGRSRGGWGTRTPRRRRGRPRSGVPAAHGRAGGGLPHDDPRAGGDQCRAARPRTAPHPPGPGSGGQGLLLQGQPGLAARPPHPRHDPGSNTPPAIVTEPASPDYVDVTSNRQTQTIDRDSSLAQMPQRAVACSHGQGLRQPSG